MRDFMVNTLLFVYVACFIFAGNASPTEILSIVADQNNVQRAKLWFWLSIFYLLHLFVHVRIYLENNSVLEFCLIPHGRVIHIVKCRPKYCLCRYIIYPLGTHNRIVFDIGYSGTAIVYKNRSAVLTVIRKFPGNFNFDTKLNIENAKLHLVGLGTLIFSLL